MPDEKSNAARPTLPGILAPRSAPLEPPGDHQVQHEEQVALEHEDDALAEPLQADDAPAERLRSGGSTERSRNGLARRTPSSVWPTTRSATRST